MTADSVTRLNSALAGRYVIEREVGVGGMATVYLARDERHSRNVALKVLNPELGAVLGVERFLSEIRVTANLQHPNLLPLFDSGEVGGLLFYVMPLIEGESLRARLDREKQLPVDETVRISTAIASALDYAHRRGVIHRDLKPENILMHEGLPLVADFGIALAVSNAGGQRVTQTGLSLGTPQYMSPEQATGDRVIDARTDVYSLAAVTYEMLAGEPPHSGTSAQAIIAKLMTTVPQPVRTLRPSVPANVAMAVECGLAKLPADRFPSAKAFADAMTNPSFTISNNAGEIARSPKRSRAMALVLAVVCLVLLATAIAGWLRSPPRAPLVRYAIALDSTESLTATGRWGRVAISPDGSTIVYVGGPGNGLMLRRRDELHATMIPGTEQAGSPAFSPNGSRVAFIQSAATLKIVALDGTLPITVSDSAFGLAGITWASDDMIYTDARGPTPLLRFAPKASALPEHFVALDSASQERDEYYPEPLPDNGLLYTATFGTVSAFHYGIVALDVATGKRHLVVDNALRARYADPGFLIYVAANGTLLAAPFDPRARKTTGDAVVLGPVSPVASNLNNIEIAVSRAGTLVYVGGASTAGAERELVWVNREGKATPVDSTWRGSFADPAISYDGSRVAVSTSGITNPDQGDIFVKRFDTGGLMRLTVEGGGNRYPAWSPDGRSIFYTSSVSGGRAILEQRSDGGAPPVIRAHGADPLTAMSVSPDGKWIITQQGTTAIAYVGAARLGVDSMTQKLLPALGNVRAPALSPDGKWLAYQSVANGRAQVYVVPFPNVVAGKWIVSREFGQSPVWSPRGNELFFRDDRSLISVPVSTTGAFTIGEPKRLFPIVGYQQHYDVAPDASRFLFVRAAGGESSERLTVIENWTALLARKK